MKKEVAEAWVKDLRSNPKQTEGCLFDGKGHCCLGRLALVLGYEFVDIGEKTDPEDPLYWWVLKTPSGEIEKESDLLTPSLCEASGMDTPSGTFIVPFLETEIIEEIDLARLNDRGSTFDEIADVIEENWERL